MNLTEREKKIIELMAQGYKGKQIAHVMKSSQTRVHHYISNMKRRFDYGNNEQLCLAAYKNGVIK